MLGVQLSACAVIAGPASVTTATLPAEGPLGATTDSVRADDAAETLNALYDAVSRCGRSLREKDRRSIANIVFRESNEHGYDPLFVLALIQVESRCIPHARSSRGAVGLIQIKPSTAREVAKQTGEKWKGEQALTQPAINVRLGVRYLSDLEEQFDDPYLAMAAFNLGPARVAGMSRHAARRARYVRKVLARYEDLLSEQRIEQS